MSMAALIPGLTVSVEGKHNDGGELVATSVSFKGNDLERAEAIQAGLHENQAQTEQNKQAIEEHDSHLQQQHQRFGLLLGPARHWPFQLGIRRLRWPDQVVIFSVQLDQISRGQNVLPGLIELDALIAHHQLVGFEIGRSQRRIRERACAARTLIRFSNHAGRGSTS